MFESHSHQQGGLHRCASFRLAGSDERVYGAPPVPECVEAMSAASGVAWIFETAENSKKFYLDYIKQQSNPEIAQKQLEAVAEGEPLSPGAKGLEHGPTA